MTITTPPAASPNPSFTYGIAKEIKEEIDGPTKNNFRLWHDRTDPNHWFHLGGENYPKIVTDQLRTNWETRISLIEEMSIDQINTLVTRNSTSNENTKFDIVSSIIYHEITLPDMKPIMDTINDDSTSYESSTLFTSWVMNKAFGFRTITKSPRETREAIPVKPLDLADAITRKYGYSIQVKRKGCAPCAGVCDTCGNPSKQQNEIFYLNAGRPPTYLQRAYILDS